MPAIRFEHETNGPLSVSIERFPEAGEGGYRVQTGEVKDEVRAVQPTPGAGWFVHHGRVVTFHAVRTDRGVEVWHDGRRVCLESVDRRSRRAAGGHAAAPVDELAAPMPGTILKINVKPGDAFAAHQALIVMESMKMEMTLSSPHAGKVAEIRCKVGELVAMGAVLAKLEST